MATFVSLLGISGARETLRALGGEAVAALQVVVSRAATLDEAAHFVTSRRS
jgi:hypothetical protein